MNCVTKKSLVLKSLMTLNKVNINTVNSVRLLGVTFSSSLSWNEHFSLVMKRSLKRFFILRNLKRARCSSDLLYKCYVAFIRSIMLYAIPCICNAPKYLFENFLRVERRASRYFSDLQFTSFTTVADQVCEKLFRSIVLNEDHPLRSMFLTRPTTRRNSCPVRAPFASTKRFSNSFIRYANL